MKRGKIKDNSFTREDRFKILEKHISKQEIEGLLTKNYSYGMIYDLLKRDKPNLFKEDGDLWFIASRQTMRNLLVRAGLKVNIKAYNAMPQKWKLQFKKTPLQKKINDSSFTREDRFKILEKHTPRQEIEGWLAQNYSYGMIYDLLKRDKPHLFVEDGDLWFITSAQVMRNLLTCVGFEVNTKSYNAMPQKWKLQFKYPKEMSLEEIGEDIRLKCFEGQKITVQRMKENNFYERMEFHRHNSPLCVEFYTKRGFTQKEASEKISKICSSGAVGNRKKIRKRRTKIEKKVSKWLEENGIEHSIEYTLRLKEEERTDNRRSFIYDFFLKEYNTLVEVNGTYWHADKRFFSPNDLIHKKLGTRAEKIWDKDKKKVELAKKRGYNVEVLWEYDIRENFEGLMSKFTEKVLLNES